MYSLAYMARFIPICNIITLVNYQCFVGSGQTGTFRASCD